VDKQERVWVVDRENNRIQIFNGQEEFLSQWVVCLDRPSDIYIDDEGTVFISELRAGVSIYTIDGKLLTRWGSEVQDTETALFLAAHAIAVDSHGDLYVGEAPNNFARHYSVRVDRGARTVQKFARLPPMPQSQ